MSSKITIIRHAPTEFNKNKIFMGTKDVPVDIHELTGEQIDVLRNNAYLQSVDAWYASPLSRALDTARAIAVDKNIVIDDRLIERCLGDWQGVKKCVVQEKYPDAFIDGKMNFYHTPINGEPYKDLVMRISQFLVEKSEMYDNLVIVTHNGVFRVMKSLLTGERLSDVFSEFEPYLVPQTFDVSDDILEKIADNPFYTADR